jgi:ribosomal protein S18 acetylase RimI-like enzyme
MAEQVRELLFHRVVEKVRSMQSHYGLSQVRLASDMMVSQKDDIDYLARQGFLPFEQVYFMGRETADPIPAVRVAAPITLRQSNLSSQAEQTDYLQVYQACFPSSPKTGDDLQVLLQSPLWDKGRMIAAYSSSNELVGSLLVYWDEQKGYGVTDDVMVLPPWRGQNIAKHLIGEGIRYFQTQGIASICLEVKASNTPAVAAYTAMGYRIINQESLLGKLI